MRLLPLAYAVRNGTRSPGRLLQLVIGAALVVLLITAAASFARGMRSGLSASGDPANAILVGAGAENSIERSAIDPVVAGIVAAEFTALRRGADGPAVSPEIHHEGPITVAGREGQAQWRGVMPAALTVHRRVRLLDGRWPGTDEVLVGRLAHHRLGLAAEALAPGAQIVFEGRTWTVSGTFAAPGTVLESELWTALPSLMQATRRTTLSCVALGFTDPGEVDAAETFALIRLDLELVALREADYYASMAAFFAPLRAMAWLTAALIAAGAAFGGLNTLYAAFSARIRELATLQAIGFSRLALAVSLLLEAVLAVGAGTGLGLVLAVVALDGRAVILSSGIVGLSVDPPALAAGLIAGLTLAVVGTLVPAWRCLAPPLPSALRSA